MSRSTLSKAFSKSTKMVYKVVFHSRLCSMILRSVAIWSVVDRSCRKLACSSRSMCSFFTSALILSRMILLKTFPGTEKSVIPLQLGHSLRFPFLGNFIRCPRFQSLGISSEVQIFLKRTYNALLVMVVSIFKASGGISSGPAALLALSLLTALSISAFDGGSTLTLRVRCAVGMTAGFGGNYRFSSS